MRKKIFIFLFDGFADWEIAYLTPQIQKNQDFQLVYFSEEGKEVSSMGGLKVSVDLSLKEVDIDSIHMLILPGGDTWESDGNDAIESLVKALFYSGKNIAAICAATTFLGKLGILNHIKHTSNDLNYLKQFAPDYSGDDNYNNSLAVADKNIITASGIASLEFTKEVFTKLELYSPDYTEKWFQLFKNGVWAE